MIREIKFRGISTEEFRKGQWIYGNLHQFKGYAIFEKDIKNWISVAKNTIGQYTGLKDKCNREIYEGDIVEYETWFDSECRAIVRFGEYEQDCNEHHPQKCVGWYLSIINYPRWLHGKTAQNLREINEKCEVISNIY